jgi:hypothetical protein
MRVQISTLLGLAIAALQVAACGGKADSDRPAAGEPAAADRGGAPAGSAGSELAGAAGTSPFTGGAGGSQPQARTGGTGSDATGGSAGLDCSVVGCAAPPLCSTGCLDPCGCCPCEEGSTRVLDGTDQVCSGGCWAPAEALCEHRGQSYVLNATFWAGDGCNTCTCGEAGAVTCTERACLCDPEQEIRIREYVGSSPEQCAVIDFACPPNTTYFANSCGCGCEQRYSCPEYFNCMPSVDEPGVDPCDEEEIEANCPYSVIAY